MTRIRAIGAAVAVVMATLGILAGSAAAHESRTVGPYTFIVGWINEPAIVGQPNGLDLTVSETASGTAVEGLEKTLTAEVIAGGGAATKSLDLAPDGDMPGHYTSDLLPTRVGDYTFHISGTAGTTKIDEKFESGPNRFDPVTDGSDLQFPDKVATSADLAKQLADANGKLTLAIALGALGTVGLVVSIYALTRSRRVA
jgi:hypothetical protein